MLWTIVVSSLAVVARVHAWGSPFYYSSSGCKHQGFELDSTGRLNRTLPSGRTYLIHVPQEYNGSQAHPLVLSFHGGKSSLIDGHESIPMTLSAAGGTSANQEKLSQFSEDGIEIAGLSVIAAYPQGAGNTDENRTGVWYSAPYANTSVDDVSPIHFFSYTACLI